MARVFICGMECEDPSTAQHWEATAGAGSPPRYSSTGGRGVSGKCYRWNPTASSGIRTNDVDVNGNEVVVRVYMKIVTLPSATTEFLLLRNSAGTRHGALRLTTTGRLQCQTLAGGVTTNGTTSDILTNDEWHCIDFLVNMGTTIVADARYDGNAVPQVAASSTADVVDSIRFGGGVTSTHDIYFDDLVIDNDVSAWPIGEGKVVGFQPVSDGTHSFTAGDFTYSIGGNVATTATDVWSYFDDSATANSDYIAQAVLRNTSYVECLFGTSSETVTLKAVDWVYRYSTSSAANANFGIHFTDGDGGDEVLFSGIINSSTGATNHIMKLLAPSGLAWTNARWNTLRMRAGYSSDVTPIPRLHAMLGEVEFQDIPEGGGRNQIIMLGV